MKALSRRTFLTGACATLSATAMRRFPGALGLEIYSLRREADKDLPATLALIRKLGFTEIEGPASYGRGSAGFRRLLDDAGLKATSMMADHARFGKDIHAVADDAHALGVEYVVCSTIPHKRHLTAEECHRAADDFNRWGEVLAKSALHLCYHTHGIEFDPSPDGTLFDTLVKRTDAKYMSYEMDIFWIVYAYQDPVKLLHKYPGRFPLMHVKDIRKNTVLGGSPGDVLEEESVVLGAGLVDVPAALRAGLQTGVRHFYIEDEAVDATRQIPESLRYLEGIQW